MDQLDLVAQIEQLKEYAPHLDIFGVLKIAGSDRCMLAIDDHLNSIWLELSTPVDWSRGPESGLADLYRLANQIPY